MREREVSRNKKNKGTDKQVIANTQTHIKLYKKRENTQKIVFHCCQ